MRFEKKHYLFFLFLISLTLLISYLSFPKSFGRKCSCSPQCDFANLKIDSCSYSSNSLKLKMTNTNVVNLNVIIGYLVFPNRTYQVRYLTDHIPSFTTKEILIENTPSGISSFTITTECPNIKLQKNITDCYY
ncbi:MAG: hypothetical protein J4452_04420 [Candidatus Aenigmarchaeota archaeon]|nr:hypothetical protein [Candidatus Aenigmarchaeota archaeon]